MRTMYSHLSPMLMLFSRDESLEKFIVYILPVNGRPRSWIGMDFQVRLVTHKYTAWSDKQFFSLIAFLNSLENSALNKSILGLIG